MKGSVLLSVLFTILLAAGCKPAPRNAGISRLKDLNSSRFILGGETGSVPDRLLAQNMPRAQLREYESLPDMLAALQSGKIHAFAYDRPALDHLAAKCPDLTVLPENLGVGCLAVGIAGKSAALQEPVNRFIQQYRRDGTYRAMYDRWLKSPSPVMPELPVPASPQGTLIVGIECADFPFCFLDHNGRPSGFDTEFALRLAAFMHRKCEFRNMPYTALFAQLASNRIDIAVSQIDATPERRKNMLFSEPYIDSSIGVMLRKADVVRGETPMEKLHHPDMRIGVLLGINATLYCEQNFPSRQLCYFPKSADAFAAILHKRIDAFFLDRVKMELAARKNPKLVVLPESIVPSRLVIGLPKKHAALCGRINDFIRQCRKDGTRKAMYQRWCNARDLPEMPEIPAPEHPVMKLRAGVFGNLAPLCFYAGKGKLSGHEPEFIRRLALYLNADIEIVDISFPAILAALEAGKIDFLISGMNATEERAKKYIFTDEYIDSDVAVMVHRDFLQDRQAGSENNSWKDKAGKFLQDLKQSFEGTFITENRWQMLLKGLKITLAVAIAAALLGTVLAFPVCMMRRAKTRLLQNTGKCYILLMQGTPILILLMLLYYVVFADCRLSAEIVAIIGFSLNFSVYVGEMLRTGIDGIPRGQIEAAEALGFSRFAIYRLIILPQAVRTILPVYRGTFINLLKSTSIVGYIAIQDLTRMSDIIRSRTYEAFFPLITTAVIYFAIAWVLALGLSRLEHMLNPVIRRRKRLEAQHD